MLKQNICITKDTLLYNISFLSYLYLCKGIHTYINIYMLLKNLLMHTQYTLIRNIKLFNFYA